MGIKRQREANKGEGKKGVLRRGGQGRRLRKKGDEKEER